jgi:hypothetical protein
VWLQLDAAIDDLRLDRLVEPDSQILLTYPRPERQAQAAWQRRRGDPAAIHHAAPIRALAALATSARDLAQRLQARPVGYFRPAGHAIGQGLLLQMPAMKAWLQTGFVQAAAVPHGAPHDEALARAGEAVVRQCLALSGADDSFERRCHLVQLFGAVAQRPRPRRTHAADGAARRPRLAAQGLG